MFGVSHHDHAVDLGLKLYFLVVVVMHVPLGETGFALTVLEENEADLG